MHRLSKPVMSARTLRWEMTEPPPLYLWHILHFAMHAGCLFSAKRLRFCICPRGLHGQRPLVLALESAFLTSHAVPRLGEGPFVTMMSVARQAVFRRDNGKTESIRKALGSIPPKTTCHRTYSAETTWLELRYRGLDYHAATRHQHSVKDIWQHMRSKRQS
jgi:hypothetical protein